MKEIDDTGAFLMCSTSSRDGVYYKVSCKLGLWSVEGSDCIKVLSEAVHYFEQYRSDGEYHEIIGGPTINEVMMRYLTNE
jgi:hypothetical protein